MWVIRTSLMELRSIWDLILCGLMRGIVRLLRRRSMRLRRDWLLERLPRERQSRRRKRLMWLILLVELMSMLSLFTHDFFIIIIII
jgi:hypothetical protein